MRCGADICARWLASQSLGGSLYNGPSYRRWYMRRWSGRVSKHNDQQASLSVAHTQIIPATAADIYTE
jgi:hypothetical protein